MPHYFYIYLFYIYITPFQNYIGHLVADCLIKLIKLPFLSFISVLYRKSRDLPCIPFHHSFPIY